MDDLFWFRALMDSTTDSIYFKDRECRLLRVNRQMVTNLGLSGPDEVIGKTDIELFGGPSANGPTSRISGSWRPTSR